MNQEASSERAKRLRKSIPVPKNELVFDEPLVVKRRISVADSFHGQRKSISDSLEGEFQKEGAQEDQHQGTVSWHTYWSYWHSGNSVLVLVSVLCLFVSMNLCHIALQLWVAKWAAYNDLLANNKNQSLAKYPNFPSPVASLYIYLAILLTVEASKAIHASMIKALVYTRMYFFETNSAGRILNRLSKDISFLDEFVPIVSMESIECSLWTLEMLLIAIISSYYAALPVVPVVVAFFLGRKYYLRTSRELKRMDGIALSPIFTHITSITQGLPCVRAAGSCVSNSKKLYTLLNSYTRVSFMSLVAERWIALRLDLLSVTYASVVLIICVLLKHFSGKSN
ncbi:hypothetical protein Ciccas_004176 [Cichlidogyrus casuarinus]|uniref:ABC transmembrane type-1 domain-containing protein n=1 Tax=Cichlidogyrus casuarinus TaxID=1844966 RepID=A0ABD2QFN1_9PLAT